MTFKSLILGGLAALSAAMGAQAQTIDGNDLDAITAIASNYGSAALGADSAGGDPLIEGRVGGVNYWVYFENCTDKSNCEDIRFYTAFCDYKPALERINEWNLLKRWGRAYLDEDLDAALDFDVNLVGGLSPANLDSTWGVWVLIVDLFTDHIGYDGPRC